MVSVRQVKAARALLAWSLDDLATHSGVGRSTLGRLEMVDEQLGGYATTRDKIVGTFEAAGITFLSDSDGSEGVMIRGSR